MLTWRKSFPCRLSKSSQYPLRILSSAVPLIAVATLLTSGPSANQGGESDCVVADKTPPPVLRGNGGDRKDYIFEHLADVDEDGAGKDRKYVYKHVIDNKHPGNILFAEWPRVSIEFQAIAPGSCGHSVRESLVAGVEDAHSIIKYGEAKQLSKEASAYVPGSASGPFQPEEKPRALTSRLYANLSLGKNPFVLDISFATATDGPTFFSYSVTNHSSGTVLFRVENLASRWASYGLFNVSLGKSEWVPVEKGADLYKLLRGRGTKLTVSSPGTKQFSEELTVITVFVAQDQEVARGPVSLYLPPVRIAPR
jgi:hypothetical protein